jgi:hypothetical protein
MNIEDIPSLPDRERRFAEHTRTERRLAINAADLEAAFDDASDMLHYYLDLETGKVVAITDEIRYELNAIYKALGEYGDNDAFAAALQQRAHPDWMRAVLNEAHQVEQGYGTSYIAHTYCSTDLPSAGVQSDASGCRGVASAVGGLCRREIQC